METFQFQKCLVVRDDRSSTVLTVFDDCLTLCARPEDTADYLTTARSLGYLTAHDLNREHDLVHCFLAERLDWQGEPVSPALRNCVEPGHAHDQLRWREEEVVLAFQAVLNGLPVRPCLPVEIRNRTPHVLTSDHAGARLARYVEEFTLLARKRKKTVT